MMAYALINSATDTTPKDGEGGSRNQTTVTTESKCHSTRGEGGGQPKRIGRRADTRPQDAANKTKRKAKVKWQATSNKVE